VHIGEKPLRNSAGFCGGGQGLSWAVEARKEGRKEGRKEEDGVHNRTVAFPQHFGEEMRNFDPSLKCRRISGMNRCILCNGKRKAL
jgi:hypothetical protein